SARSWLIHKTHITRGAAVGHAAWAKRTGTHPKVLAALAAGQVTEPAGRLICLWTGKLPEKFRDDADEALAAAAAAGLGLGELAEAMRRLVAANLLPERAGQPVKAWVHISLADLLLLDADSALQAQWTAQIRERWAARRAFASQTGCEGRRLAGRRRRRRDRL